MSKKRPNPTPEIPPKEVDQGSAATESKTSSSAGTAESRQAQDADNVPAMKPEQTPGSTSGVIADNGPDSVSGSDKPLDPTRYGDWVKNGRCIDF